MLHRKPRRGDLIEHISNWKEWVNGNDTVAPVWETLGKVTRVDGNICWVNTLDGRDDFFIWHFDSDGALNRVHRIHKSKSKV